MLKLHCIATLYMAMAHSCIPVPNSSVFFPFYIPLALATKPSVPTQTLRFKTTFAA